MNSKQFDELYANFCDKLRESGKSSHVLEQIVKQQSDYERVQFLLSFDQDIVPTLSKNIAPTFEAKDDKRAQELLEEACCQNSVKVINQALRLCYSKQSGSRDIAEIFNISDIRDNKNLQNFIKSNDVPPEKSVTADIFSRRSAILFQDGKFESCIRDTYRSSFFGANKTYEMVLRLALSYKHLKLYEEAKVISQHALEVLRNSSSDNEAKCKETIRLVGIIKEIQSSSGSVAGKNSEKVEANSHVTLKLFEGQHSKLNGVSSALTLNYTPAHGRHIVALRNIPPGASIIIEDPFAWSLSVHKYPSKCQYCMKPEPATSDGIPCEECSAVMFCNEECKISAMKLFHKYECKILNLLDSSEKLGRMALLSYRVVSQVPVDVIIQSHNLLKQQNVENASDSNVLMGYNGKGKFDSSDYISVFAQTTNSCLRNGGDLLKRTYAAVYLCLCLRFVGYFGDYFESELTEPQIIVASVLLRHFQSNSCNAYGVNQATPGDLGVLEIEEIGGAAYPVISTTNHNCNPNVYRFNIGRKCVVNTLHEIYEGEEIFDSYGPLFTTTPLKQRLQEMESQYLFKCSCRACINNWPNFEVLRSPQHTNHYYCLHCFAGKLEIGSAKEKRKCAECGKATEFKKVHKVLKSAEDKYLRAKELVLKQKLEGYDSIHKCICNYILTVQKLLVAPTKELVEAEEVLKLLWSLSVRNGVLVAE